MKLKDLTVDQMTAMIEVLNERYPAPENRAVLQPEKISEFNFACGQRSVVEEIIAERKLKLEDQKR